MTSVVGVDRPAASHSGLDARSLRTALGAFATGVTIVTTRGLDTDDVGLTANSFSSVSLEPPMVLWSLSKSSSSIEAFRGAAHFAVHVLSSAQETLSTRFASKGIDKFAGVPVDRGPDGVPMLRDCAARFTCRTVHQYEGGDHVIFVGEVLELLSSAVPPLVFHGGRYSMVFQREAEEPVLPDEVGSRLSSNDLLYHVSRAYFRLREKAIQERGRRRWSGDEYAALSLLGREDGLSATEIALRSEARGRTITSETLARLATRGLINATDAGDGQSKVTLTPGGREAMIEMVAMLKSSEAEILETFDRSEVQLLKQLLRRIGDSKLDGSVLDLT